MKLFVMIPGRKRKISFLKWSIRGPILHTRAGPILRRSWPIQNGLLVFCFASSFFVFFSYWYFSLILFCFVFLKDLADFSHKYSWTTRLHPSWTNKSLSANIFIIALTVLHPFPGPTTVSRFRTHLLYFPCHSVFLGLLYRGLHWTYSVDRCTLFCMA